LCNNDEAVFDYFIKILAVKVQDPGRKANVTMLFRSVEGVGKDLFFDYFGNKIIGSKYYSNVEKASLYFGRFNSVIEDKVICVVNEQSVMQNMDMTDNIKNAITCDNNTIEHKGQKPYSNKNHITYIFLANAKNPVTISPSDRRFCAVECCNTYANDKDYIMPLIKELESGEYDRLFYDYLMKVDLSTVSFTTDRPETSFYKDLKEINIPVVARFLESFLMFDDSTKNVIDAPSNAMYNAFNEWKTSNGYTKVAHTSTRFGLDMKEYGGITKVRSGKGVKYVINKEELLNFLTKKKYIEELPNL